MPDSTAVTWALGRLRPYRRAILFSVLGLLITASTTLSIGQGLRLLIDQGIATASTAQLRHYVMLFGLLVLVLAAGTYLRHYWVSWLGERVVADIRRQVFDHLLHLHPGFFEQNRALEIQSRLTTDTTVIQAVVGSSVSIALRNLVMFVGGLIWLFITNTKLTLIVVVAVPLVVSPILLFGRRVRGLSRDSQDRVAEVGAYVGEILGNIKTVQAYHHEANDRNAFKAHVENAFQVAVRRNVQRGLLITSVILLVLGAVALMLWVGGRDVIQGRISGGELAAFVFYSVIVGSAVASISEVIGELQRAAGATQRIYELLRCEPDIQEPAVPAPLPQPLRGQIDLREVTFCYASRPDNPALEALTLRVRAVDGIDIRTLALRDLRACFAIVTQAPVLFYGSILDNIRYGRPDASRQAVEEAAKAAHAHDFIQTLPRQYDTPVGDAGSGLSGGQKQRIAIARALLVDAPILLLDEATSALDAHSEQLVQQALERLMQGRTTLVIAHRLATVKNADRIAVLNQGRLEAIGTHEELEQSSPLYQRLHTLQFKTGFDVQASGGIP